MSLGHGAKIVKNGLVFAYDMGPNPGANKSWKGKPTTNLVSDTISQSGWSGSYSLIDSATKTFNVVISRGAATGSAWRSHYWSVSSYVGSSVTISMDVELISENNATFTHTNVGQGNTGSFPYHIAGSDVADRVRVESLPNKTHMTWSGIINSTGAVGISTWINQTVAGGGVTLRISNVQIEANEFETPFVNGTRSNTEALLDWAGNNTISPVDLEYTNNIFRFNGLGERDGSPLGSYIPLPGAVTTTLPSSKPDGVTYDIWLKADTDAPDRMGLFVGSGTINHIEILSSTKNFRTEAVTQNGYSFGAGGFPDSCRGVWSNFTIVFANNETNRPVRWYQNGKLFHTHANMGSGSDVNQYFLPTKLGSATGSAAYLYAESFKGEISALKIYDRSLTENEIKQNFIAFRGRHGL